MALVYSTDHGRTCPGCRQSLAACICKADKPIPAGDGIVRVSREKQGGGGKTVTVVRGLMLDAMALTTAGRGGDAQHTPAPSPTGAAGPA